MGCKDEKRAILVVDDRWENRSIMMNLLQPLGVKIIEATNGKVGFEKALKY
jgi:CheY-like chemotaxis protein